MAETPAMKIRRRDHFLRDRDIRIELQHAPRCGGWGKCIVRDRQDESVGMDFTITRQDESEPPRFLGIATELGASPSGPIEGDLPRQILTEA